MTFRLVRDERHRTKVWYKVICNETGQIWLLTRFKSIAVDQLRVLQNRENK